MTKYVAWVYILSTRTRFVLYTGSTTDLPTRTWEHVTKQNPSSFTAKYNVNRLVYYQGFLSISEAEAAEKYIKGKSRPWKIALITKFNPKWRDLRGDLENL